MGKCVYLVLIIAIIHSCTGMMTGGWSSVDNCNSEDFMNYVNFATSQISSASNSVYHMKAINCTQAYKQVVSGMNYKFKMLIQATECKKNAGYSEEQVKQCNFLSTEPPQKCDATVWVQAWKKENGMKLTKFSCKPEPKEC